jgi:predicted RNase H-like HicB family nuclease
MAAPMNLTAFYELVEDGWVQARVRELPSVITAAPTRDEARILLEDAVREYLMALLMRTKRRPWWGRIPSSSP